jgi:hypothetical protein
MLQGLQTITVTKGNLDTSCPVTGSLPDELNTFYAHFEAIKTEPFISAPAVLDDCGITLSVADVSQTIEQVNIHKVTGPD